jgi:phosphoribosylformimino-5-aminoimidazole carboxamide ribonucleotide (ProFAR) isomerase
VAEIDVLPRILVLNGEAAYEEGNEYYSMEVDTLEVIDSMISSYGKVLIVDLNGVFSNRPRLDFIKKFEKKPIWVDAGPRLAENVIDVFVAGAEKAVMSTKTLSSVREVARASELSHELVFQADVLDGQTVAMAKEFQGRNPRDLLEEAMRMGINVGFYLETGRNPPHPSILRGFPEDFELYLGMLPKDDATRLADTGMRGAVVDVEELI